jgi:membrane-associated progesterone receptor component
MSSILTTCTVFAGKDPSRALATSSLKAEDCVPDWSDLDDSAKTVLSEWYTFFSKRYNQVGKVSTTEDENMNGS